MNRPALGHREIAPAGPSRTSRPTLIALGGRDDDVDALAAPLAAAFRVIVLEPPRRAHPRRPGLSDGPGDWLLGDPEAPEPLSLGLCLEQLEQFLLARADRPVLLGAGQGATLAMALALIWPERLRGVVALGGALPELPAGGVEEQPLDGLPLLRLAHAGERVEAEIARLRARGADVRRLDPQPLQPESLRRWLAPSPG